MVNMQNVQTVVKLLTEKKRYKSFLVTEIWAMKKSFRSLGAKNVGVIVKSLTKVLMVQKNFSCTIRLILNTLYMII